MSQEATVSGVVHVIEETKTFGSKGFRKRLVVLEDDSGHFTQYIPIEFIREGCDTVDELNVGDQVQIRYRLGGRKWQRDEQSEVKFFLSAEALSFEVIGSDAGGQEQAPAAGFDENEAPFEDDEEDIPF